MKDSEHISRNEHPLDAYDITLSGVADEIVGEELDRIGHYESSNKRVFRVSGEDLLRLRLAIAERCGEHQLHPGGPLWSEQRVYTHSAVPGVV